MQVSPGIRAARERAEAFNVRIEAEAQARYLRQRTFAAERQLREILLAGAAKYAPLVHEQAAHELGRYFSKKFMERAETELGPMLGFHAYAVAERAFKDHLIDMAPQEIREWFYNILEAGQIEIDADIYYRSAANGQMAAETHVEHRIIWPRDVYISRMVIDK